MTNRSGFTITELMFAMTGVAVLLLILLGATIQLSRTYNKGLTLKRVNQSGRTLGEEMLRTIRSSTGVTYHPQGTNAGRLCAGGKAFLWNLGDAGNIPATEGNRYTDGELITLVKVENPDRSVCTGIRYNTDIRRDQSTQLLADGLVMREMTLTNSPSSKIVNLQYIISTPSEELIDASSRCGGDDDFCALNRFNVNVYTRSY